MDYIFFQVAAINGFDSFGHYLRAGLIVNTCSTYTADPPPGCSANFAPGASGDRGDGQPSARPRPTRCSRPPREALAARPARRRAEA